MGRIYIYIIAGIISSAMLSCKADRKPVAAKASIDTIPALVAQVKKCSRLYTAEYKLHKIITHSDEVRAKGKIFNHEYDFALPMAAARWQYPSTQR